MNEFKKDIIYICLIGMLIIIIGILIFRECKRKPEIGISENIEQLDTETEELRDNNKQFRAENQKLRTELENGETIINRLEKEIEIRNKRIMEILESNENICYELGTDTELLRIENEKFRNDIIELEKIFQKLDN